jgi:hypothetical protein
MKKSYMFKNGLLVPLIAGALALRPLRKRTVTVQALDTAATLNPILTMIANQFMADDSGFVANEVLPPFGSALQSAQYYMFKAAELAQRPNIVPRAPGTAYPRLKLAVSNDNYFCQDYGMEGPVADEDRAKYSSYFDLDTTMIRRLVDTQKINREQRVYNLVTGGTVQGAGVAIKWNDAQSQPKTDTDAAREQIRAQIGLMPNTLVLTQPTVNALSVHPKVVDFFKYTVSGVVDVEALKKYFQIPNVVIARSINATNNEGQVYTAADIWGNNALLCFSQPGNDLSMPNFGRTFYWTAFTSPVTTATGGTGPAMQMGGGGPDLIKVMSYRDETVNSDIHRTQHYVGEKLTAPLAGFLIQNPLG